MNENYEQPGLKEGQEEGIIKGMAAEAYEGVCTDLPPPRKR